MDLYLGIDFGTSGARAVVIDSHGKIQTQTSRTFSGHTSGPTLANHWQQTLFELIQQIPQNLRSTLQSIAINGTSGTVLLCDSSGQSISPPLLYNDARGAVMREVLRAIAPPKHTVLSATSSLVKLLWWWGQPLIESGAPISVQQLLQQPLPPAQYFLHQADWLAAQLHGQWGVSDYHNALKLGYDVGALCYPDWLTQLPIAPLLPKVVAPGTKIATVTSEIAQQFDLPTDCQVHAGTTDSIAAFLASGANTPGEAVTSIGSTLVLKLLSETRVDAAQYGIYSHRYGDLWLVGGASNTGGAVLKQFFSTEELDTLSYEINPKDESPLDYYPLLKPGERFPVNDPNLPPRLEPRPDSPVEFLHGLLESIARIEHQGYQLLQQLGATPLSQVYTAGGGAKNLIWTVLRSRHLGCPVSSSIQTESAYGTALLALRNH